MGMRSGTRPNMVPSFVLSFVPLNSANLISDEYALLGTPLSPRSRFLSKNWFLSEDGECTALGIPRKGASLPSPSFPSLFAADCRLAFLRGPSSEGPISLLSLPRALLRNSSPITESGYYWGKPANLWPRGRNARNVSLPPYQCLFSELLHRCSLFALSAF